MVVVFCSRWWCGDFNFLVLIFYFLVVVFSFPVVILYFPMVIFWWSPEMVVVVSGV